MALTLAEGATVSDAIEQSDMAKHFPDADLDALQVGIWGRVVSREQPLNDGDRVELYRPLQRDPREARRQLAATGGTMGRPGRR